MSIEEQKKAELSAYSVSYTCWRVCPRRTVVEGRVERLRHSVPKISNGWLGIGDS